MARRRSKNQRSQRIFLFISLMVIISMAASMVAFSFTPRAPTATPASLPTSTPFPTRTPMAGSG